MFAVPSFFGYNTTFVSTPVATAATGVGETSFTANWNAFAGASYYLLDVSTSSSFSSFVLQDQVVYTNSYAVTGLTSNTTYYYRLRASTTYDTDAEAFFTRVSSNGGSLTTTEQQAVNSLVIQMKADGTWTLMKAIYPMVGGGTGSTAAREAACAQNLKSSSFTGTFSSGWTFASTGVTGNGTSTFMDTTFNPNTSITDINSCHLSIYSRTTTGVDGVDIGASPSAWDIEIIYGSFYAGMMNGSYLNTANSDAKGLWTNSRISSSNIIAYRNGSTFVSGSSAPITKPNCNVYIGARSDASIPLFFSNRQYAFASIGDGLTSGNVSNLYTAVQAFQTTLSRQV
jgi:hypothetical protein